MKEKDVFRLNGFFGVILELILLVWAILSVRSFILGGSVATFVLGIILVLSFFLLASGFTMSSQIKQGCSHFLVIIWGLLSKKDFGFRSL